MKNASWNHPKSLTYQEFSLRAGLASKSFLKDVISRRKRLTPNSFQNVVLGLGLSQIWADYLEALIGLEEKAFQNRNFDESYFAKRIQTLKKRLKLRKASRAHQNVATLENVFLEESFPEIYAALGTVETGSTLSLLSSRTQLPPSKIIPILSRMSEVGLVVQKGESFLPIVEALNVEELKTSEVFRKDYHRSLEKAKKRFPAQVNSEESLFLTQTFSVQSADLKKFKERLRNLIHDFVADGEAADGNTVAEVTLAFTRV
jgi:predicted outer membrane protein